jgi:fatty acid/phospholipid biosynthesis enzyme
MRIAVDAMGGDRAPDRPVAGAPAAIREAARDFGIVLVGDESRLTPLPSRDTDFRGWGVLHAPEAIGMDESPASAALTPLGRIESLPRSASMVVFPNRAERPDLANPIGPPAVAAERGER